MAGFRMDDYVDVAERIREFYERFPDGSLQTGTPPHIVDVNGKPFVVYHARAFRHADDTIPGDGWAWEPVPGPTQFTRDSELMNAETAAWGRAIVSLGFATKKIASAQEVRARASEGTDGKAGAAEEAPRPRAAASAPKLASEPQRKRLFAIAKECGVSNETLKTVLVEVTGQDSTKEIPAALYDAVEKAVRGSGGGPGDGGAGNPGAQGAVVDTDAGAAAVSSPPGTDAEPFTFESMVPSTARKGRPNGE